MSDSIHELFAGDITAPAGYRAAGVHCGLKRSKLDLALILSDRPATVAGVFTRNVVKAAPVLVSQRVVAGGAARAILCNSGNANCCTGERGMNDAQDMASQLAEELGLVSSHVAVCSTGHIGAWLDMAAVRAGIPKVVAELGSSGAAAAEAVLTTDTVPKTSAARIRLAGGEVVVGGMSKGAGMIHPDMATTLCFLTTDAAVPAPVLQEALGAAIDGSFNCITVDGDTSTNDTALALANGAAGVEVPDSGPDFDAFVAGLAAVALELAKMVVRDAEGGTKLIGVTVEGAADAAEAKRAANTIATSPLVKTAFYGCQANWGRIIAAAGRASVAMVEAETRIWFNSVLVAEGGMVVDDNLAAAEAELRKPNVDVRIDLASGAAATTVWTSDLTEEYIRINGSYIS
ncbi:MAG: bifunctional glutamate N-acetyltransferase/amino-acid acetyltransferase ArgJ [Acidobacteriota bacterium]|nr:bifunctional glutamate N-acetyltransferase/amino-acid acetyltransferase ArgJ [Acidobacteriota bacterium]